MGTERDLANAEKGDVRRSYRSPPSAILFYYRLNHEASSITVPHARTGESTLPRRANESPEGTLLLSRPTEYSPTLVPLAAINEPSSLGSLCTHFKRFSSKMDYVNFLKATGERGEDLELLGALAGMDLPRLETFDLDSSTGSAREISFLARLGLLQDDGMSVHQYSISATDVDRIEEMKIQDPQNIFWPMLEYSIKKREGVPVDPAEFYINATRYSHYRNPLYTFYTNINRGMLTDPRKFYTAISIYADVPIIGTAITKALEDDIGSSGASDLTIAAIGDMMAKSQIDPHASTQIDGVTGVVLDYYLGRRLRAKAMKDPAALRSIRQEVREEFSLEKLGQALGELTALGEYTCDESHLRSFFQFAKKT